MHERVLSSEPRTPFNGVLLSSEISHVSKQVVNPAFITLALK